VQIRLSKPEQLEKALAQLASEAAKHGISFEYNLAKGSASGRGFAGHYAVHPDHIMVTVTKKPFIVPGSVVEEKVKKYWTQVCAQAK